MTKQLYQHYTELEDIGGDDGQVHNQLLKLDINKDILISYFINESKEYKDEKISFLEFKMRVIEQEDFLDKIFLVDIEEENFGVRIAGGEMWVASYNQNTADLIFEILTNKKDPK
tara:strand:- start:60 stop:404 length:345 start_codon:yes stop_codon:yes gene_type:complete